MVNMDTVRQKITLEIEYIKGNELPEEGIYMGGLKDPLYTNELVVWVEPSEEYDDEKKEFEPSQGWQINIGGSRRSLFELGKILIGLSELKTKDNHYHEHLDDISTIEGQDNCKIILHHPNRFE